MKRNTCAYRQHVDKTNNNKKHQNQWCKQRNTELNKRKTEIRPVLFNGTEVFALLEEAAAKLILAHVPKRAKTAHELRLRLAMWSARDFAGLLTGPRIKRGRALRPGTAGGALMPTMPSNIASSGPPERGPTAKPCSTSLIPWLAIRRTRNLATRRSCCRTLAAHSAS